MAAYLPALPTRPLGNTGLKVSCIGFGASPLGSVFNEVPEQTGIAAVRAAFAYGITYFDTSPFYGDTRSELVLGRGLQGLPRHKFVLATKVGRYGADTFDFSAPRVTRSVHESLARLQTSYIDLIQMHDIEFVSLDQIVNETIPALVALRKQGLVRHIGITGLPLKIFPYVLERAAPGSVDLMLSYCHLSLNDATLLSLLPKLTQHGVGVVSASPLSMGLLTQQGPPEWHPAPMEVKAACREAAAHCASRGTDLARLALQFSMLHDGVASHLVGMASPEQVQTNVQTVLEGLGLEPNPTADTDASALAEVKRILEPVQGMTWASGLPENN